MESHSIWILVFVQCIEPTGSQGRAEAGETALHSDGDVWLLRMDCRGGREAVEVWTGGGSGGDERGGVRDIFGAR